MIALGWYVSFLEWLHQVDWPREFKNYIVLPIVGVLATLAFELARRRYHWFENRKIDRSPRDVFAESLIDRGRVRDADGRALVRAINRGALDRIARLSKSPAGSKPSSLEDAWNRTSFEQYASVAATFITPRCTVAPIGGRAAMVKVDALAVLLEWLQGSTERLHGEIRGDTGVGKTMLLHQLFYELAKSKSNAVPMLASADNINQNSQELERLKYESNHLSAFVSVWLKNRRVVAKNLADEKAIIDAIGRSLEEGEIVLLLDGVDELRAKGAAEFVDGLLFGARRWIVTRRYEESARQVLTGHVLTLESAWRRERILEYAHRRLDQQPETASRVEAVLRQLIPENDTSSHWLSLPSNLRAYLDEIASSKGVATQAEMHRLAESAIGLMDKLVSREMGGIPGADPTEIRDALSILALCRPGDLRARCDSPIGKKVAGMKTLLRNDGKTLVFRHAAQAEYFLARQLARELLEGPSKWSGAEAFQTVAAMPWGTARIRLVDEWLRTMDAVPSRSEKITFWLRGSSPLVVDAGPMLAASGKRNLLEVWKKTRFDDGSDGGAGQMEGLNLDDIDGRGLDLRNERIKSCTFVHADLRDAEMMHAQFVDCRFAKADLRFANAIGADFERCSFGEGEQFAKVEGLEIEGIQVDPPMLESQLLSGQARSQRSRYRGKFGEQFLKAQRAFLGRAVDDLETKTYVPAIRRAIAQAIERTPDEPVYLIDLMAGGHGGRSEELLGDFPRLRILSIDRDAAQRALSDRHQWMIFEFGAKPLNDPHAADPFALEALLRGGFEKSDGKADIVIAKKAFHELQRELQPALIRSCGAVLRPGGHLVMFVDAPGAEIGSVDSAAREVSVQLHEELRSLLLDPATSPADVTKLVNARTYLADANGEWLFVNDWIAVKDWANSNRHELAHRYFASIAELCEWADPGFGEAVRVKTDWYDINPLRFNERGVNWVLHYLERNKDREVAIAQHRAMLADRLAGSEEFGTLVNITRAVFERAPAFARMMGAQPSRIQLTDINSSLAPLETAETAPQFELKCAVLDFERRSKDT